MKFKKLIVLTASLSLLGSVSTSLNSINIANASSEPQLSLKKVQSMTWHQIPRANNIKDVKVLSFNPGTVIGKSHGKVIRSTAIYTVKVNGYSFEAATDSPLGKQLNQYFKHHHKYFKETK